MRRTWLVPPRDHRAERMDRPDQPAAALRGALRDIGWTNRWLGGCSALLRAVRPHLLAGEPGRVVELLDVGTGGADLPRAVVEEACRLGRTLRVTAIDSSWPTACLAAEAIAGRGEIRVVCADARRPPFAAGSFDLVTASMFLHHFADPEVVGLLASFRRLARRAVVVNDLRRHLLPWGFIHVASRLTARHPMYVHDAPLSVLRGFTAAELSRAARAVGADEARVRRRWPYRLVLELPAERRG